MVTKTGPRKFDAAQPHLRMPHTPDTKEVPPPTGDERMVPRNMMYGNAFGVATAPAYRMERGFPFQRAGKFVTAVPQFKGLFLFPHTNVSAYNSFSTTVPTLKTAWPQTVK